MQDDTPAWGSSKPSADSISCRMSKSIVSSKVDLVCWTGRVGLVCRDCREALTTGDAGGARRILKRAAIEGATGTPLDLRQLPGHPCRTLQ